jgi:F-type H+-transporting ATPase subunit b
MELLQDTHVWFAASFIAFLVFVLLRGRKAILGMLDERIAGIRNEISTAEALYAEARQMHSEYQQKHENAVRDAARIRQDAVKNAAEISRQAEADLIEAMERREKQLEDRLARMKQSAISEIQQYAADLAAAAAAEIIAKKLDKNLNEKLVDRAIEKIGGNLH